MQFDGDSGFIRGKDSRIWKTRLAIDAFCSLPRVHTAALERIVCHCTWIFLLRRRLLSVFGHVYEWIHRYKGLCVPLWQSVVRELRDASSLLPLAVTDLRLPWSGSIAASDAEGEGGLAVVTADLSPRAVASMARTSELWRY